MELIFIQQIALTLATLVAAVTDFKTGLITDWTTYPLVAIGLGISLWTQNWVGIGLAVVVFVFLYGLYYMGKIGGGDVKLFTGMALVLPFYNGHFFLLSALFYAGLTAIIGYTLYYLYKIKKDKHKVVFSENKTSILKGALFFLLFTLYAALLAWINALSVWMAAFLWAALSIGCVFIALETVIKKHYFCKTVAVSELGDDELLATEFTDEKVLKKLNLGIKGVIGSTEKQKLLELGIKKITIYATPPKFGPFIFIGTALALWMPDLLTVLFLRI